MVEEIIGDMIPQEERPKFFRSKTGIIIIIFLCIIALGALASWYLSRGRISSVAANVDALIYTVETKTESQIENIYVNPGDLVRSGQVLARIDYPQTPGLAPTPTQDFVGANVPPRISERLIAAQQAEKEMTQKVNQARDQEEKLRLVYQELVTEHARSQLAMRSINMRNQSAYNQARANEEAARANMERARDTFEQYSRMRAAQDAELKKIRAELQRYKRSAGIQASAITSAQPAPMMVENDLLSPVAGKVLKVLSSPGQIINAGQPIFVILPSQSNQSSNYWIQAWFPLSSANDIKPGQKVNIHLLNRGLDTVGKVVSIADDAQMLPEQTDAVNINSLNKDDKARYNSLRYLPVRISIDAPAELGILEPGSKVTCQIQTRSIPGLGFLE